MIILHNDILTSDISLKAVIPFDSKANILSCFQALHLKISKSLRKDELAVCYDQFFHDQLDWIIECLPKEEYLLLQKLLEIPQGEYVEHPRNDEQFLFLQECYMVLTYEDTDTWHLYMTDYVRNIIKKHLEQTLNSSPALKEMTQILERSIALNNEMMTLMEQNDPNNLTDAVRNTLKKKFQEIESRMEAGRCRLKELEPELKQYTTKLESVYERIDDGLFFLTMAMITLEAPDSQTH